MATSKEIANLVINKVESQTVYDYMVDNNLINDDELYFVETTGESDLEFDSALSSTSENAVQNKVVNAKFDEIESVYETKEDAQSKLDEAKGYADSILTSHIDNKNNPHEVTKEQVGLGNVDNTSDMDKPVSTAQSDAINIAKKAGDDAQANLDQHIDNKNNPHEVNLTQLGVTATADELNIMDGVTATTAELNYVDGVTSNIQTQLNGKQAAITGAATTIASSNLAASRALVSNSSGKVAVSAVTSTELGYLDGVTSNIQTQLNNKMDKDNPTGTGSFSLNRNANSEIGNYSFAEGYNTIASGKYSHAEGQNTIAFSDYSHAEGRGNITSVTITGDANANTYTLASADSSLLVGQVIFYRNKYAIITAYDSSVPSITVNTTLSDKALNSVSATLYKLAASGSTSHAEGWNTVASGSSSHTEGSSTAASGNSSHAECYHTTASGQFSHAEGCYTTASGDSSHAEGNHTTASGKFSHAGGYFTIADGENQTVIGKHNVSDTTSSFIIGNGTGTNARSNAHTIDGSGNAWFSGDVYVGSTSGKNKDNGSRKLASITETWTFTLEDGSTVTKAVYVG